MVTKEIGVAPLPSPRPGAVEISLEQPLPVELQQLFEAPLRTALARRGGDYHVCLRRGRDEEEVLVVLTSPAARSALPLFFPRARQLERSDVLRILRNVLEGMGPGWA